MYNSASYNESTSTCLSTGIYIYIILQFKTVINYQLLEIKERFPETVFVVDLYLNLLNMCT